MGRASSTLELLHRIGSCTRTAVRMPVHHAAPVALRDRQLARFSLYHHDDETVTVDVTALVHSLLLFDQVVMESARLKEVPELVRVFGAEGLRLLLNRQALRFQCEAATVGQIAQLSIREGRPVQPFGTYGVVVIREGNRGEYVHSCLQELHTIPGLTLKQIIRLKGDVAHRILTPAFDPLSVEATTHADIVGNAGQLTRAIALTIHRERGDDLVPAHIQTRAEAIDDLDIRIETNLQRLLNISKIEEHNLVERALVGIGALNLRLEHMRARSAVSAFEEDELPLFDDKLRFIIGDIDAGEQHRRLSRVVELGGLSVVGTEDRSVDVEKLIELRESPACREFRAWLRGTDGVDDSGLREGLPDLRDRLAGAVRGKLGRGARFAVSTGAGVAAGNVIGTLAGGIDGFLIDRLLPRPGPMAWLAQHYPSLFEGQ
jgi:hypothetical protein